MITREQVTYRIVHTRLEHVDELEKMQGLVFPTLSDNERFSAAKFRRHIELFPQGQFVAQLIREDAEPIIIGSTSTFRTNFDFDDIQHTYLDAVGHGWLTNHNPDGEWLYGADLSVHPDYRRRGIGSKLYRARQKLVERLNLRGEIAGGMLPGYGPYLGKMTVEEWIERVIRGDLSGPTLSMQLASGFKVRGVLYDHIHDPHTNNCAALIVRDNKYYRAMKYQEAQQ